VIKFIRDRLFAGHAGNHRQKYYIVTTRIRRNIFASSIRPRLIRDLTVPSGICRASTIS
jgi:hypothetical protein